MNYYIYIDNEVKGPYTASELKKMDLPEDTHICEECEEGKEEWKSLKDIAELNNTAEIKSIPDAEPPPADTTKSEDNNSEQSENIANSENNNTESTAENSNQPKTTKKNKNKKIIIISIAIALLLFLFAGAFVWWYLNGKTEELPEPFTIDENLKSI